MKMLAAFALLLLRTSAFATPQDLAADFGFRSPTPIQIEDHAWLVNRPYYVVGAKSYWLAYEISGDINLVDRAICKHLGFTSARDGSRRETQPASLQPTYNYVMLNNQGSILSLNEGVQGHREYTIFWDQLICER